MFRKPRDHPTATSQSLTVPSIGRPPTPPIAEPMLTTRSATPARTMASKPSTPVLGRSQTTARSSGGNRNNAAGKAKGKVNGSILNFFKKAESTLDPESVPKEEQASLFFEDNDIKSKIVSPFQIPTPPREDGDTSPDKAAIRYNEDPRAVKRRRTSDYGASMTAGEAGDQRRSDNLDGAMTGPSSIHPGTANPDGEHGPQEKEDWLDHTPAEEPPNPKSPIGDLGKGPFVEDPESEDDMIRHWTSAFENPKPSGMPLLDEASLPARVKSALPENSGAMVPSLHREGTSLVGGDGFEGMEDFVDDEFPEDGEEYMERLWMKEQEGLELDVEDESLGDDSLEMKGESDDTTSPTNPAQGDDGASSCPICSESLEGITPEEASIHVNHCLDGKSFPLPKPAVPLKREGSKPERGFSSHKRFQRAAIARPGQQNPFTFGTPSVGASSAFSRLMSSHAEDTAWAEAAAAETASRGKPAFQRTCPFYKILPGFFICVDAFRYGAVEGCSAYFLSHFHSDHYIGLTSSWCHGPIYCSHVTANLVRRQLRVDPKWVVDLEFEQKAEVPGTQGVDVTMIPANHCPGSSLFLFEKVVGKGKTPKVQRVLHCGDFRACPAHVQHPLLRPDVVEAVTGKSIRQQKLDVCYLDTTYLTPKYAFPSQEEVIKACADMCVSLSKEIVDKTDGWELTKKEQAGSGMVKFVQKGAETVKQEVDLDDVDAMKANTKPGTKSRGRLLVIVGTYSIGKERICLGVARALNSKIYAPPNKQKICAALEDPELMARLTNDPLEAQVHMQMLMEIRAETLADYLTGFKPHFSRIVGFRPSGWNYRPPNSRFVESPAVQTVLHSENWRSKYSMAELVPQRGSTREASCFGVPYSEHSSFRELTMFCCALRIDKIIPTVNVGSAKSREKMKGWCEKWAMEKKKNGLFKVADGQMAW